MNKIIIILLWPIADHRPFQEATQYSIFGLLQQNTSGYMSIFIGPLVWRDIMYLMCHIEYEQNRLILYKEEGKFKKTR